MRILWLTTTLVVCLAASVVEADPKTRFAVIVHPENPVVALSRDQLSRIYRRHDRFWSDGRAIVPMNAPLATALRDHFSRSILGGPPESLSMFWNRRYFEGVSPPPVLRSDTAMVRYVSETRGAIGYVRTGSTNATIKIVRISDGR